MSIARKHKARILAAIEAGTQAETQDQAPVKTGAKAGAKVKGQAGAKKTYNLMVVALEADLSTLKGTADVAERAAMKKDMLPKYMDYLDAYRAFGARHPNEVLTYAIIWSLDVGDLETALELADLAIEQQQILPARFQRDLPTFVADEIHDWAERQIAADHSPEPYLSAVIERMETGQWVVSQIIVAGKLYKQAGLYALGSDLKQTALALFEQGMKINPKAGLKTRIKELKESLEK